MEAGRLSDLILFQKPVVTTPGGYRTVTWTDDFQEWAEAIRSGEMVCQFILRYRTTEDADGNTIQISAKTHRILWDGCIWTITNCVHDRKRSMLTIDSDQTQLIESTDLISETTEYVDSVPIVRPPSS